MVITIITQMLLEKCPKMEFFLVRIFPYSDHEETPYLDTFHTVER